MSAAIAKNGNLTTYRELAREIADNGYMPLPIQPGFKRPEPTINRVTGKKWTKVSHEHIDEMVDAFGDSYVGIRTDGLAAIDIDVYDSDMAEVVKGWVKDRNPDLKLMVRHGRKPKLMIIGRAEHENQRKRTSAKFEYDGHDHQIEVLGCGQQLVAYAIHPDTNRPYLWGSDHLVNTPKAELGVITDELVTKLFENFERIACARGWKMTKGAVDKGVASDDAGHPVVVEDYDLDKTRDLLRVMTDHNLIEWQDYDQWIDVGMVLNMQGQGAYEWLELWQEFSEPDAHDVCADKWATFDYDRGGKNLDHLRETLHKAYDRLPQAVLEAHDPVLTGFPYLGDNEAELKKHMQRKTVPTREALIATWAEVDSAELTPKCIVEDYLYADLAQLIAPGGVGKTTILLHELICIALARPVWGLRVVTTGWCLLVTAEDQRARLLARLKRMMDAIGLSRTERNKVLENVLIWDVTEGVRRLAMVKDGNVVLTTLAEEIVETYKDDPPVLVVFDPLVSFGASENMVNDNEQGMVNAARKIIGGLECCVRYVHHTGKANAREQTLDQYSGRNGSALPDGARMNFVMATWRPGGVMKHEGQEISPPAELMTEVKETTGFVVMNRAKLSYSPPNLPLIWIRRDGYVFDSRVEKRLTPREKDQKLHEDVVEYLSAELGIGNFHTKSTLEKAAKEIGSTKAAVRKAVDRMRASLVLRSEELPDEEKQGSRTHYLHPAEYIGVPAKWPSAG